MNAGRLLLSLLCGASSIALAQDYWQQTSGPEGGRVYAITRSSNGNVFAGATGGVFKSTNNGTSWSFLGLPTTRVTSLISTSASSLTAATYDYLWRSTDEGSTWSQITNGLGGNAVEAVLRAANGTFYAASNGGVRRSTDGGLSWNATTVTEWVFSLAENASGHIFAGSLGSTADVYRSTDGGITWSNHSFSEAATQIDGLTVNSQGHVFAAVYGNEPGVYRSTDNGVTWTRVGLAGTTCTDITVNAGDSLYVSTFGSGVFQSTDGGTTWQQTGLANAVTYTAYFSPTHDLYAGTSQGIFRSSDLGAVWTKINSGLNATYVLSQVVNNFGRIFAATGSGMFWSDDGNSWQETANGLTRNYLNALARNSQGHLFVGSADGGLFRSSDDGSSWAALSISDPVSSLLVTQGDVLYMGTYSSGTTRKVLVSTDNGDSWTETSLAVGNPISAMAITNSGIMFASGEGYGVYRSTDGGSSWNQLTTAPTNVHGFAFNASGHLLAAGASGSTYGFFRSTDNGNTWATVMNSSTGFGTAMYAASNGYLYGATTGAQAVYRSTNGGTSWSLLSTGIDHEYFRSFTESPTHFIYAGSTGGGVYRSVDPVTAYFTQSATLTGTQWSAGQWGDYDNDGDLDILMAGLTDINTLARTTVLYRNTNGSFSSVAISLPAIANGSVDWGDYDNDGDIDILITGNDNVTYVSRIYRNDNGNFVDIGAGLEGVINGSGIWGDYDNDGDLDIILTGSSVPLGRISKIYRNDGGGVFTDVGISFVGGGVNVPPMWGDFDTDGDLDLLLAGLDSSDNYVTRIYRNDSGTFININATLKGIDVGSVAWGDYDSDGDLDILISGDSNIIAPEKIYRNDNGIFVDIGAGLTPIGQGLSAWGDFDNDGDLDILQTGGRGGIGSPLTKVYRNDSGNFVEIGASLTGVMNSAVAWGDYDNDGDLDIFLSGWTGSPNVFVTQVWKNNIGTANTVPSSPTGLAAVPSADSVNFGWSKSIDLQTTQNALTYNLRVGTSLSGVQRVAAMANLFNGYRKIAEVGNIGHGNSWTLKGLPEGDYYWNVQAIDNAFVGSSFATEQMFSIVIPPLPPQGLTVIDSSQNGQVSLRWNRNLERDFLRYRIHVGMSPNPTVRIDSTVGGNAYDTTKTVTSLIDGSIYYFRLTAVDSGGNESAYSNEVTVRPNGPPTIPQNVTAIAGDGLVSLSWNKSEDFDFLRYRVYGGTSPNPTSRIDSTAGGNIDDTTKTIAGVINGTTHYFRVTAVDAAGNESGYSNEVSATPMPPPAIGSFDPTFGPIGTTVTINGSNFESSPSNNIVFFGAVRGLVTSASSTSLNVIVPAGATYQPITVTVNGRTAYSTGIFRVTFQGGGAITSGSFAAKVDRITGSNPEAVAIGDLDGDSKADLAVSNYTSNTISVFRNTSTSGSITAGSFAAKVDFVTGAGPTGIAIADLDGDGRPEMAVTNYLCDTISIFYNTSTIGSITAASFAAKADFAAGGGPTGIAIHDLDGDGRPDIAVTNYLSTTLSIFRNTSTPGSITTGSFAAKVDFATGYYPFGIALGDLDGDGKPDLAVVNFLSNLGSFEPSTVSVFRNTATSGSISVGSFAAKVDFTAGISPVGVAIGDLDDDGKLDLAVTNSYSNTISVLRNTCTIGSVGSGSFAANVDFSSGSKPWAIGMGDLDGDGKIDLAATNYDGNSISVLRNVGATGSINSGSFAAKADFVTASVPWSVAVGDLDADGKADLVAANTSSNSVSIFRNRVVEVIPPDAPQGLVPIWGNEQVLLKWTRNQAIDFQRYRIYGGTSPLPTTRIDSTALMNANDTAKVITGLSNGSTYYFRVTAVDTSGNESDYSNEVTSRPDGPPTVPTLLSAFAGDGRITLLWTMSIDFNFDRYRVYRDTSPGPIVQLDSTLSGNANDTGKTIFGLANGTIYYFRITAVDSAGNESLFSNELSSRPFGIPVITSFSPTSGPAGTVVTISGGNFDPIQGNNVIYFGAAKAAVTSASTTSITAVAPAGSSYRPITVTVNGLKAYSSSPFVLTFPGDWSITNASLDNKVDLATAANPAGIAIADLDADGKSDLIVADESGNAISVFHNMSSIGRITVSSFAAKVDFTAGSGPHGIDVDDLDGDGRSDIVVTNRNARTISVFRNTSAVGSITVGSLAPKVDFTTGRIPSDVAIQDLDMDGKPDLVVTAVGGDTLSIFHNIGAVGDITADSFGPRIDFMTNGNPEALAIGDLNGDGKPEIAVVHSSNFTVSVFENISTKGTLGLSSFAAKVDFAVGSGSGSIPVNVAIADFDMDGKPDLAAIDNGDYYVTVLRNLTTGGSISSGSFAPRVDFPTGSRPWGLAVGDINGDGKPDLAVTNRGNYTVSLLENTSTLGTIDANSFASRVDFQSATGSSASGGYSLAVGDLDGDGHADLASTNYETPTVSVFRSSMNVAPSPPEALVAIAGDGKITLTWNRNAELDFLRYRIYGGLTASPTTKIDSTAGGNSSDTARVISGLSNGTAYYLRLTAVDSMGNESGYSNEVTARPNGPPTVPQNVAAVAGDGQVSLSWNKSVDFDFLRYRIYGGVSANPTVKIDSTISGNLSDTARVIPGLSNGTTYYFRLTAVDSAGNESGYSNDVTSRPDGPPTVPTLVNAIAGNGQVALRWTKSEDFNFSRYRIYEVLLSLLKIKVDSTSSGNPSDTTKVVVGLTNGDLYHFRITAVDSAGNESDYSNDVTARPDGPPTVPVLLGAAIGNGQVTLRWTRSEDFNFSRYRVHQGSAPNPSIGVDSTTSGNPNDTSKVVVGLTNGVLYHFRITAVDSAGNVSAYSNEVTARPNGPPTIPQNVTAVAGNGQVSLSWNKSMDFDFLRYRVYEDTSPNPDSLVGSSTPGDIADTTMTVSGLTDGIIYYFRVTAVDGAGNESGYSNQVTARPNGPPTIPQNVAAVAGDAQVSLTWNKSVDFDFLRYRVYGGTSSNPTAKIDSTAGGNVADTTRTVAGLVNGLTYYFRVTAVDSGGNESAHSNEVNSQPDGSPSKPTLLSATIGDGQVVLCWSRSTDFNFARYRIYRGTSPNPIVQVDSTSSGNANDTAKVMSGLTNGTTYFLRITAVDSMGNESGYSNELSATLLVQTTLSSPANGSSSQSTTLTLGWNLTAGASSYRLQVSINAGFVPVVFEDSAVSGVSKLVTGLANGQTYQWRVLGQNSTGHGPYSATYSFSTTASLSNLTPASPISYPAEPTSSTDYRIVSVPGATSWRVDQILTGSSPYDWRVFRDNGLTSASYLEELTPASALNVGEGYWLVKKGSFNPSLNVTMPTLSSDGTYSIPVRQGYNIIANPFNVPVQWAAVCTTNTLWDYGPSGYVSASFLQPFKGYYFINDSVGLMSLKIPFPFPAFSIKIPDAPLAQWKIRLEYQSDINRDAENYLGTASTAKQERDKLDIPKPPLVFDQGFLYFNRPSWSQHITRYSTDFRPVIEEGQVWDFEVSNPRKSSGMIRFSGINEIPANLVAVLVNLDNTLPVDIRKVEKYEFQPARERTPFKLIIGTPKFVDIEVAKFIPTEFSLDQNYPNPFNPATSIRFALPHPADVSLEVFSLLGERIATLTNERYQAGFYTVVWNGTDDLGNRVSSGVYFSRLLADQKLIRVMKMILLK